MKKSVVFLVLIVFCLVMLKADSARKPAVTKMNITRIDIDQRGYFNYHGQVSNMIVRGEEVVWICNAPFTVYFGKESPIVSNSKGIPLPWGSTMRGIQSQTLDGLLRNPPPDLCKTSMNSLKSLREKLKSGQYFIARAWVSRNALSGKYKYIIAAYVKGRVWVDDPEDIIDPPPRMR